MVLWEKKKIFDCFGKIVFDESFGYGIMPKLDIKDFKFFVDEEKSSQISDIFIKQGDKFIRVDSIFDSFCESLSSQTFYACTSFIDKTFEAVNIVRVVYETPLSIIGDVSDLKLKVNELKKKAFVIDLPLQEFFNYELWSFDGKISACFIKPGYNEIRVGEKYYFISSGVVEISKAYLCENENSPLCDIKFNDTEKRIVWNDSSFVTLPFKYNEILSNAFSEFELSKNEEKFSLYVQTVKGKSKTICYQPIEYAEKYIAVISKVIRDEYGYKCYHLKDYYLSKNTHCFYIPDEDFSQFGSSIYVKLIALDGAENELASTKYINFN